MAAAVLMTVVPTAALAQGCAMCYTSASAAKQAALESLQNGIIILLAPPLLMFVGILWLAFRRRNAPEAQCTESAEDFAATPSRLTAVMPGRSPAENHLPENARIE